MSTLEVWYSHVSADSVAKKMRTAISDPRASMTDRKSLKKARDKQARALTKKARRHDSAQALAQLGEVVDGQYRIVSQPPFVVPLRDWSHIYPDFPDDLDQQIRHQLASYGRTLQPDRRQLLARYELVDAARKVVGVGSVGTRAFIALLQGKDTHDPLFLQLKEANRSVLESHLPRSRYRQPGQRVVHGQRMMQASSDIFLGWTHGVDGARSYYWRQLRDMKGSANIEAMTPEVMTFYAGLCGSTLARAHARSGDPVAIAAVPGRQRRLRPGHHPLRQALRSPERTGLPGVRRGRPHRPARRSPRGVTQVSFDDVMEVVVRGFEIGGVTILVVSSLAALVDRRDVLPTHRRAADVRGSSSGRRTSHPARPRVPDHRRHRAHDHRRPDPRELPGPRAHRAGADLPQLLPRDRAGGHPALAPSRCRQGHGHSPPTRRIRVEPPDTRHGLVRDQGPWLSALTWRQRGCWPTAARGHFRSQRSPRDYLLVSYTPRARSPARSCCADCLVVEGRGRARDRMGRGGT